MKPLQIKLTKYGDTIIGKAVNLGEWDISVGMEKSIYIHNPNKYAKADLTKLKNKDSRVRINLPDEIHPGQTAEVLLSIEGQVFKDDTEEEEYFTNVLDQLSGKVVWRVP